MCDYKKGMKLVYYESRELEIIDSESPVFAEMYFRNIYELAELIKTSPEAAKKLKELI